MNIIIIREYKYANSERHTHAEIKAASLSSFVCVDRGPKYHLLAHTTLSLSHVQDSFRTHDLTISGNGEWQPPSVCLTPFFSFLCQISHLSLFLSSSLSSLSFFSLHYNNFPYPCLPPLSFSFLPLSCLVLWQTAIVKVTVVKAVLVRWLLCKSCNDAG